MPYLELGALFNAINCNNKVTDASNATAISTQVRAFLCPSEIHPQASTTANSTTNATSTYGLPNYARCEGAWFTYGGAKLATPNSGAIGVNPGRTFATFSDGSSNSLLDAEVQTYAPADPDCGSVPGGGPTGPTADPEIATVLASVAAAANTAGCRDVAGSNGLAGGGHTRWSNGNSFQDGFTTALPPNTASLAGSPAVDRDMSSEDEDDGAPTYASVTSRSYHPGGVNALFGDGSVKFVKSTIQWRIWRSIATVNGGEVISADAL